MSQRALGMDGTSRGWVAVVLCDGRFEQVAVVATFTEAANRFRDVPIAIDIPIGLVDDARRDADVAARAQLSGSASSVFGAPCRTLIDGYRSGQITGYTAANASSRQVTGAGLSRQAWALVPKIAEVDAAVEAGAEPYEVHPELSFRLLAGRRLAGKRTWNGIATRLGVLRALGVELPDAFEFGDRVPADDVFDAAIVAWTAAGLHHPAELRSHPPHPAQFDRGRPIVIWTRNGAGRSQR